MHKTFLNQYSAFLLSLFVCACGTSGGSGDDDDDDSSDIFSDAEWRLVTNWDVQAGITFEGGTGAITIVMLIMDLFQSMRRQLFIMIPPRVKIRPLQFLVRIPSQQVTLLPEPSLIQPV